MDEQTKMAYFTVMAVKNVDFSSAIALHRKKSGLSRLELASLCGVGKTVIYDIEHGKNSIRLDKLLKILNALNISIRFESPLLQAQAIRHEDL
jgi:HTH-type transcriptional regulator / antitoxin HipB